MEELRKLAESYFANEMDLDHFALFALDLVAQSKDEFNRIIPLSLTDSTHHENGCEFTHVTYRPQTWEIDGERVRTFFACEHCGGRDKFNYAIEMLPPKTRDYFS